MHQIHVKNLVLTKKLLYEYFSGYIYFCFPGGGFASFNNFQQHQESQQASSAEQGPLAATNNNNNHGNVTKADNNVGEGPFQNAFSAGKDKFFRF